MAILASKPVVGSSRKSTGGSIISSMPIFVLFFSPPETPRILCVPTCKTSQSEQPSIHVPHSMNYNTDCSNSSRLPLVDHTDQFHQTQSTPFYRGLCGTHRFTYSHQNSYTYRSHQPNDFHADSQSSNLLHPHRKSAMLDCLENTFSVISCTHPRVFIRSPQTWST